jgi:hypothetical protein
VGGELPLKRPSVLELIARSDDPEAAAGITDSPSLHRVVLVVHGVLVLVVHLAFELRFHRVHQ